MRNQPKVSVIIPVYNVERYLSRCLDSVVNQTYSNLDIICINDGSTDNSLKILDQYKLKDKRIKVINQRNCGISATRNVGISYVKGDYLLFVDSDDWIESDMIQKLVEVTLTHNCDVTLCMYERNYSDRSLVKELNLPVLTIYNNEETKFKLFRQMVGPIDNELKYPENLDALVTIWGKLYKSNLIINNQILFIDTDIIGSGEDLLFNIQLFDYVKSSSILNMPLYHYWKDNLNSCTTTYRRNLPNQWKQQRRYIKEYLNSINADPIFYKALNNRICISTLGLGLNEFDKSNNSPVFRKLINFYSMLNDNEIKESFRNFDMKYLPLHWKVFYLSNKYKFTMVSYFLIKIINILRKVK